MNAKYTMFRFFFKGGAKKFSNFGNSVRKFPKFRLTHPDDFAKMESISSGHANAGQFPQYTNSAGLGSLTEK